MISNDYPIDFVIPWVEGSDPAWLEEKNKYSPVRKDDSNSVNRYRDWGLLKYWFRAVEKFTPWVNRIHFVTWGHIPAFLNTEHPKINIVRHEDYIPKEYLPTFSSTTIETNLHRIEGLSEHFVYFNDDIYLLRPTSKEVFFKEGLPCCYYAELPFAPNLDNGVYGYNIMNDVGVVNRHFRKNESYRKFRKKYYCGQYDLKDRIRTLIMEKVNPGSFSGFKYFHSANPYLKSVLKTIWDQEPDILDKTGGARFRSQTDVNQCVIMFWQFASGQFEPAKADNLLLQCSEEHIDEICLAIKKQSHDMLCLNDNVTDVDTAEMSKKIIESFETILPEKSHFEK